MNKKEKLGLVIVMVATNLLFTTGDLDVDLLSAFVRLSVFVIFSSIFIWLTND